MKCVQHVCYHNQSVQAIEKYTAFIGQVKFGNVLHYDLTLPPSIAILEIFDPCQD